MARAINMAPGCRVFAVGSRAKATAEDFISKNRLPATTLALGSYDELIASECNAIYIPLPTFLHLEWSMKAVNAGKHILVEKPVALSAADLRTLLDACKRNNVLFMDCVMFMHNARTKAICTRLSDPFCGAVSRMMSSFAFRGDASFFSNNIRCSAQGDPLGAVGDLGWYIFRFGLLAMSSSSSAPLSHTYPERLVMPTSISARCQNWSNGVPLDCEGKLVWSADARTATGQFSDQRCLVFDCSFLSVHRQRFEIVTVGGQDDEISDAVLTVDDFCLPRLPDASQFRFETHPRSGSLVNHHTRLVSSIEISSLPNDDGGQEVSMVREFHRQANPVHDNTATCTKQWWGEVSLATQIIVDACMASMRADGAPVEIPQEL
eukprot:gnl/Spiro4/10459_TR5599_c0_g1_i1.p1 gnl/Spiro4/10459_TR5599_c0_g1~~gnl/Spiro4/10459_TR5599_c0_g1_i1.p1  ORF type:complete len:417 (+),score=130.53 gnl/Spiro4/10459_TR5599_c0_g1_i1:120-1253(+)